LNSIRILLDSAIDYAGLFPPAGLDMRAAVDEYALCRDSEMSWALGRFVLPASRLEEFEEAFSRNCAADRAGKPWPLSALCGTDGNSDIERISEFNRRVPAHPDSSPALVDTAEFRVRSPGEIQKCAAGAEGRFTAYFEIPLGADTPALISAIAASGSHAKVRTGGPVADLFPAAADLAVFIDQCCRANVRFKATAGLHHPFRSLRPLGNAPVRPSAWMHGFLNLFIAAAIARTGSGIDILEEVLAEENSAAFVFGADGVSWRSYRLTGNQLQDTRRQFAVSFGSCSFREPIDDLRALHLL
jgi:hypothetical protein